jgi:hypothetical protein
MTLSHKVFPILVVNQQMTKVASIRCNATPAEVGVASQALSVTHQIHGAAGH